MLTKRLDFPAIFCISILFLTSCGSPRMASKYKNLEEARAGTLKEFKRTVGYLDRDEIAPVWKTPFKAPTMEFLHTLPKGRILVGVGRQRRDSNDPLHGPIVMYRVSDGSELWRYTRKETMKGEYAFLTYTPAIIFLRKEENLTTFFALNAENGLKKWEIYVKSEVGFELSMDHHLLLVASKRSKGTLLKAFDLKTGNPRWEGLSPVPCRKIPPQLYVLHGRLWVIGDGMSTHDISSGKMGGKNRDIGPVADRGYPLITTEGVLLSAQDLRFYRLKKNGDKVWSVSLPHPPGVFTLHNDKVYISYEDHKNKKYGLTAVNYTSGQKIWKRNFKGQLRTRMVTRGDRLYLVTGQDLLAMNSINGRILIKTFLPASQWRAADRLVPFEDHLAVVQETSIGAYRWDTLKPKWVHVVRGAEPNFYELHKEISISYEWPKETVQSVEDQVCSPAMFAQTAEDMKQEIYTRLTHKKKRHRGPATHSWAALDFSWMNQARRTRWLGMYKRGSITTSNYSSFLKVQAAWERSMAMTNMLASSVNFMLAVSDMEAYLQRLEADERRRYQELFPYRLASIIQAQRNGIYGPYCVRPFIRSSGLGSLGGNTGAGRWGFLIVDMRNGAWREITTSPDEYFFKLNILNLIPVLFTTDGDMLITRGTGLKTDGFQLRIGWGDKPSHHPALYLMAYRLKDIPLKPANRYHKDKKLIFGKPFNIESALSFIQRGKTTLDEIKTRLGEPFDLTTWRDKSWAKWIFVEEYKGIGAHDGVKCYFNKKWVVTKVKRECYPYHYTKGDCLTVDQYIRKYE